MKKFPLLAFKEFKKQPRAQYSYRFDINNEIAVRWNDNNVVAMAKNLDFIEPLGKVKLGCKNRKQKVDFDIPRLFMNQKKIWGK